MGFMIFSTVPGKVTATFSTAGLVVSSIRLIMDCLFRYSDDDQNPKGCAVV
jgi:hypothetical protein